MIITIDGPSVSGKSSVAQIIAKNLGFYYIYSGLLYRAVAYILVEKFKIVPQLFSSLTLADLGFVAEIKYLYENGSPKIIYKGEDITSLLKNPIVDQLTSKVSTNPAIRDVLNALMRNIAKEHDVIADGRDCGTVIFPGADYKFFLTASLEVRALRKSAGDKISLQEANSSLSERDGRDQSRSVAPLIIPKDAVVIDNSDLNIEETVEKFLSYLKH
ncbi:TPA: (d)CMP kinase [Candidatus Dependentiae bacterium]|nr:MAG: Cytidylate kinase [candidate division TM6 bacterium GW2011_GWE2_31_21]KKP52963.1 MAG: Cytidylate kinase [candidate division TM6 bacterium GW2011_GWF2_33_332]HBS47799.1 (d)CMP kinase [Candidatus Dependentiae bacterium]HBZ73225.1 (d)CMP kinase [Candidatus Dependentiae bacterium]